MNSVQEEGQQPSPFLTLAVLLFLTFPTRVLLFQGLWNWFLVPLVEYNHGKLQPISFALAAGLLMLTEMISSKLSRSPEAHNSEVFPKAIGYWFVYILCFALAFFLSRFV